MAQKVLVEMLLRDSVFPKLVLVGFVFCSSRGLRLLVNVVLKFYLFILFYWFAVEEGNTYVL